MSDGPDLAALFGATDASTFLGLEACDDLNQVAASSVFLGVPGATPYGSVGAYCRNAPAALRQAIASLTANIDRHNFDLGGPVFPEGCRRAVDGGDLPYDEVDFAANRAAIGAAVTTLLANGTVPILIGGDDSVPIPMLEALGSTGKRYTVLQIDAHIDWRKSHMGEDMGLSSTMRRASEMVHVAQIIQVGARGIGSAHSDDWRDAVDWGVRFVPAQDVHARGVDAALELIEPGSEVVICLDVDALDPAIVPGVIGRAPGGLSYTQVLHLIRGAAARGRIAAMDVVEFMPEADVDGLGALTVSRLIAATMGILARKEIGVPVTPPAGNRVIATEAAPPAFSSYAQAVEVPAGARTLHISGQVGVTLDGVLVPDMVGQHEQVWRNIFAVLAGAGMDKTDIVDVAAIVTDPAGVPVFREVRDRMLEGHLAGSTLLICGLANPDWKVEIAVRAAR